MHVHTDLLSNNITSGYSYFSMASAPREEHSRFETGIGPMTDRLLNSAVDRLTSGDFRERLMDKIVDPTFSLINRKIQPYVYVSLIMYLFIIILLAFIIYLLFSNRSKWSKLTDSMRTLSEQMQPAGLSST